MVTNQYGSAESGTKRAHQNAMFTVLAHPRRRFSLQHLRVADTPIEVGELTAELAAWEGRQPAADRSDDGTDAIEVALVHNHLPMMDEAGIVEYDVDRRTVALTDHTGEIQAHLEMTDGN